MNEFKKGDLLITKEEEHNMSWLIRFDHYIDERNFLGELLYCFSEPVNFIGQTATFTVYLYTLLTTKKTISLLKELEV